MPLTIEHERGDIRDYKSDDSDGLGFFRGCMFALLIDAAFIAAVVLFFVM